MMIWEMGLPDLEQMRLWIWIPKTDDGMSLDRYAGSMHNLVLTKHFMALNLPSNSITSILTKSSTLSTVDTFLIMIAPQRYLICKCN
jgi:hypothetical protein